MTATVKKQVNEKIFHITKTYIQTIVSHTNDSFHSLNRNSSMLKWKANYQSDDGASQEASTAGIKNRHWNISRIFFVRSKLHLHLLSILTSSYNWLYISVGWARTVEARIRAFFRPKVICLHWSPSWQFLIISTCCCRIDSQLRPNCRECINPHSIWTCRTLSKIFCQLARGITYLERFQSPSQMKINFVHSSSETWNLASKPSQ